MRNNGIKTNTVLPSEGSATPPPVFKNGNGNYAASDLAKSVEAIVQRPINEPELNKQALRAIAVTSGRSGEPNARELATRSFSGANNQHIEEIHGIQEFLGVQIIGVTKHVREISSSMTPGERYIRSHLQGTPWTTADKVKCLFLIVVSVFLILIGVNTIATVLLSSGLAGFQNPVSAYLFSGIPVALAACLKAITSHIGEEPRRRRYILGIWGIGFFFGILWAYQFAGIFRGLTQTTAEIIDALTTAGSPAATPESNIMFVFTSIVAEAFLSAGCWLSAHTIAEQHQLERLTDNPVYLKKQSDLDRWGKIHHEYVQLRSQLNGKLQAIESRSHAYIEEALGFYRAAVKAASDNQRLDDFLGS